MAENRDLKSLIEQDEVFVRIFSNESVISHGSTAVTYSAEKNWSMSSGFTIFRRESHPLLSGRG